jgi:hypothetical protein
LGNLATPKRVQKLQTALHAKAKAEAGYRFYALYDKLSREDILAHAYAQCRSNKSLPLRRQGRRVWTARTSRTSKRMGSSGDWLNWRSRSERRHTDRSRSHACSMRLILFFEGHRAKRAWPVVRGYIRPNVKPKKSNSPSGTWPMRVLSSFTVSFSLPVISRRWCAAPPPLRRPVGRFAQQAAVGAIQTGLAPRPSLGLAPNPEQAHSGSRM